MRKVLLAAVFALLFASASAVEDDRAKAPDREYYIQVGDKSVDVRMGQPFHLDVSKDQELTLKVHPYRLFNKAGVQFKFPENYGFEFRELTAQLIPMWTIKGNHSVVIMQVFNSPSPETVLDQYLAGLKSQYKGKTETTDVTEKLGGVEYKGKSISPDIVATTKLVQNVFALKLKSGTGILVIQHTLDPDGKLNPNSQVLLSLLRKTFKVGE
jgi:hypothetical protein